MSAVKAVLLAYCRSKGFERPVAEHQFCPPRKWRLDFAWLECKLAVEVEGGTWIQGRHVRGKGYIADLEKYNEATVLGWRLLRVTPAQVEDGTLFGLLDRALHPIPRGKMEACRALLPSPFLPK